MSDTDARAAKAAKDALTAIFTELTRDLAAEVVHAEAYLTVGPYRQRHLEQHVQRVDATLQKHFPDVYRQINKVIGSEYQAALHKATQFTGMPADAPRELDLLTIEQQRLVLEDELTAGFDKAAATAKRCVGTNSLGREQRLVLEKAYTRYALRGGSTEDLAREIFTGLNQTAGFNPDSPWAHAVKGKFIQINGRNYNLAAYSDLVAQHRGTQLANAAYVNQAAQDGIDLVQVDDHNTTAEVCRPFEGTIWSITGADTRYPPLSSCPGSGIGGGPPFHPRCSHTLLAVVKDRPTDAARAYVANQATEKMRRKIETYRAQQPPWANRNIVAMEELAGIAGQSEVSGTMLKPVLAAMHAPRKAFENEIKAAPLSQTYEDMKRVLERYSARVYIGRLDAVRAKQLGVAGADLFAMPDVVGHIAQHPEARPETLNKISATAMSGDVYWDNKENRMVVMQAADEGHVYIMPFEKGQAVSFYRKEKRKADEKRYVRVQ